MLFYLIPYYIPLFSAVNLDKQKLLLYKKVISKRTDTHNYWRKNEMRGIKLWHIITILVIAIVVWPAEEADRTQRIQPPTQPPTFMPLPSSPSSAFTPLPDDSLAQRTDELGTYIKEKFPEQNVRLVILSATTDIVTGCVAMAAFLFHTRDDISPFAVIEGEEMANEKEAFKNLKERVAERFYDNSI